MRANMRCVHQISKLVCQRQAIVTLCRRSQSKVIRSFSASTSSSPSKPPVDEGDVIAETIDKIRPLVDLRSRHAPPERDSKVIYTAPFVAACKTVKMFSVSSCVISLLSAPVMMVLAPSHIPPGGRLSLGLMVATFGFGTTLALTAFTKPYVTRIYKHQPADGAEPTFTLEQFNLLARPVYTTVPLSAFVPLHNRGFKNLRAVVADQKSGKKVDVDLLVHPELLANDPDFALLIEHSLPEGYHEEQAALREQQEAIAAAEEASVESDKANESSHTKKPE